MNPTRSRRALALLIVSFAPSLFAQSRLPAAADAGSTPTAAVSTPTVLAYVAPRAFSACRADGDCVIAMASCCPPCGWGLANGYRAIHRGRRTAFARRSCPARFAPGLFGGVACPACAGGPPAGLAAACIAGTCRMTVPAGDPAASGAP